MRPQIERNNRKCFHCKGKIENESHFVISCPLYNAERESLFQICGENSLHFETMDDEQKFTFIMSNEFIFNSFNGIKLLLKFCKN